MRVPIAPEGYPFVGIAAAATVMAWGAAALSGASALHWVAVFATVLTLCLAFFFRDPERTGPRGSDLVLAPADGRIVEIREIEEPSYMGGRCLRIAIFLSLLDVHVNRYPVSGEVEHRSYDPGRFEPAWRESASRNNERSSTGIHASWPILVRQIAGLAAKRIVTYARIGDSVQQGERMGIIRFGSRAEVHMPPNARIDVEAGQRTLAGVTVLARLPSSPQEARDR